MLSSIFLINRLSSPLLSNKSPFELLHSKVSGYSLIRVFGCLCYQSTSSHQRHKFEPRSRACVFLGYSTGYKGYKLLDLESHNICISRHVVFFETLFPFANAAKPLDDVFDSPKQTITHEDFVTKASGSQTPVQNIASLGTAEAIVIKRQSKIHAHLQDYYCNTVSDIKYPISAYINFTNLSEDHKAYVMAITKYPEPTSYAQAKKSKEWDNVMGFEIIALEDTDTW